MITRIKSVDGLGVLSGFRWPEKLAEFERRNLIYGWNYSGKTTLSRVFRTLERQKVHPDFKSCRFVVGIDGEPDIRSDAIPEDNFPVRVFNSDYIQDNLTWKDGVDPILVLGEESVDLQKSLKRLTSQAKRRRDHRQRVRDLKTSVERQIEQGGTETARRIREDFAEPRYRRSPHLEKSISNLAGRYSETVLSSDEYETEVKAFRAEARAKVDLVHALEDAASLQAKVVAVFPKTADRELLERLAGQSDLEQWVQAGLELNRPRNRCGFCASPLKSEVLSALDSHFSAEFRRLQAEIDDGIAGVEDLVPAPPALPAASVHSEFQGELTSSLDDLAAQLTKLRNATAEVVTALKAKREDQGAVLAAPPAVADLATAGANEAVAKVNAVLARHNTTCDSLGERRRTAKKSLIEHVVADFVLSDEYRNQREDHACLVDHDEKNEARLAGLEAQVDLLESKLVASARGADVVNEYLRRFLGTEAITVVPEDGSYRLRRVGGREARNLSEGERTAIAFAYFLASLKDSRIDRERTVVYVDDPVSSLDENHLFSVFAAIKSEMGEFRQVFVSTHNFAFFRMLSGDSFFQETVWRKGKPRRRASWYLMSRESPQRATLGDMPDSLRAYRSEYHYLFDLASRFKKDPEDNAPLLGLMPNILRRILEIYTSFRVPNAKMDFKGRLDQLVDDPPRADRIYKFVNRGSHGDDIALIVEFPQSDECVRIISDIFVCLSETDPKHYGAMMELVGGEP